MNMSKLNPEFNDFAKAEKAVSDIHHEIEQNVARHGEALGWRGGMMMQFNKAYDTMVLTAYHLKLSGKADPVKDATMMKTVEHWLPVRKKCETAQYLG
ncbi:MAG: hypothetical protein JWO78_2225 [Micavibrio sp.]|nr:hypothetical protein [Micavibrio sp.]